MPVEVPQALSRQVQQTKLQARLSLEREWGSPSAPYHGWAPTRASQPLELVDFVLQVVHGCPLGNMRHYPYPPRCLLQQVEVVAKALWWQNLRLWILVKRDLSELPLSQSNVAQALGSCRLQ